LGSIIVTGGKVSNNNDYVCQLSNEEQDKIEYVSVRYGKRKLLNGDYCIVAVLKDLSDLSLKEQGYWHSFEIDEIDFSKNDEGFYRFFQRDFMGEWIDTNDPIENLIRSIRLFNSLFEPNIIYKKTANKYLKYPVNNTKKDFSDSCSELFKLIDNSNININNLKTILIQDYDFIESNFIHSESKRNLSAKQLLDCLIKQIDADLLERFKKVYKKIEDGRIDADHKILNPSFEKKNYVELFKDYCNEISGILIQITRKANNEKNPPTAGGENRQVSI
jgi:hypothetical protein